MNKQLIQEIINAGNKAIDSLPVKYTVETKVENYQVYNGIYYDDNHIEFVDDYDDETKVENYQVYNGIYYDDNHIEFVDDYDDEITLEYDKVVGIKVSNL